MRVDVDGTFTDLVVSRATANTIGVRPNIEQSWKSWRLIKVRRDA